MLKKCWLTATVCLLTTSVYIGSAIFSAGIDDLSDKFDISSVVATLGMCVFVAGYGIGKVSVWASQESPLRYALQLLQTVAD